DLLAGKVMGSFIGELQAYRMAGSPDGRLLYIAGVPRGGGDPKIAVVDTASLHQLDGNRLSEQISPRPGFGLHSIPVLPDGSTMYTTDSLGRAYVLELPSYRILARWIGSDDPHGVALTSSGALAYVANYGSGSVSVVDIEAGRVIRRVPTGGKPLGVAM